jgi:SAM-dependent methyltransferase
MVDERVTSFPEEELEGIWSGTRSDDRTTRSRRTRPTSASDDARARHHAWRQWFDGWIHEPPAKRSNGTHPLPPAYFAAAAAFIVSTLRVNPSSDRVLDVGCDSAMISRRVAPHCHRFVGVDFIPGLLFDTRRSGRPGASLAMAAADGRHLPFPDATFDKVYCSAVVHTLPDAADANALIEELIRVCRPGGEVLVSSVPDVRKRGASQRLVFRRAAIGKKVGILASWALPRAFKRQIRRLMGLPAIHPLRYLEFDLAAMARDLAARGMTAAVLDFPAQYWSVDFRTSRSSLHIRLPRTVRGGA